MAFSFGVLDELGSCFVIIELILPHPIKTIGIEVSDPLSFRRGDRSLQIENSCWGEVLNERRKC
jgi:hypothetical protein